MDSQAKGFPDRLGELRRQAGYSSAREFYKGVGGRSTLGCTYTQYLNVEAGRSTPKPGLVRRILALLSLQPGDAKTRGVIEAYLSALLKDEEFVELIRQTLSVKSAAAEEDPLRQALLRNEDSRQVRLTREQMAVIEGDEPTFWCFNVFCNDNGDWGTLDLSRRLGYDAKTVRRSLDRLKKAGIVTTAPDGRYRCFAANKIIVFPRGDFHVPENMARWRGNIEDRAARHGRVDMYHSLILRASDKRLKQYFPHLAHAVVGSDLYATAEHGDDTGLYVVEALVRRIADL